MADTERPSTMKAWLYSQTSGGLENNLTFSTSARAPPALRQNQVLVQVISASINPADYKVPEMGRLARTILLTTPATPGMDFAGRVVRRGSGVAAFTEGQLVFGSLGIPSQFGSLGEYVVASIDQIAPLPDGVDPDDAATLGIAGQTAYQSIAPYVTPGKGDKVFINAGSGGCGIFAIQIAKILGCYVTTTCSGRNVQFCKDLGADEVIDYTTQDVVRILCEKGPVYRVALDHIGGSPENLYREAHRYLMSGSTFVQVGANALATFTGRLVRPGFLGGGKRKYHIFFFKNTKEDIVRLGQWLQEGKLKVALDSTFEFEDTVKAFQKLRAGHTRGKIVIHVTKKQ